MKFHEIDIEELTKQKCLLYKLNEGYIKNTVDYFTNGNISGGQKKIIHDYQKKIIKDGYLDAPSPNTGKHIKCTDSFALDEKIIFYRFDFGENLFYAIAANLAAGFPISGIYIPSKKLLVKFGEKIWGANYEMIKEFNLVYPTNPKKSPVCNNQTYVISGCTHHLWNQLPALYALGDIRQQDFNKKSNLKKVIHYFFKKNRSKNITLIMLNEPLGPVDEIFPTLKHCNIIRMSYTDLENYCLNNPGLYTTLGSNYVPKYVRESVARYASVRKSSRIKRYIKQLIKIDGKVFWISVREPNRTIANQGEFLVNLAISILQEFPESKIIFDGYSIPEDINLPNRHDVRLIENSIKIECDLIDRIIEQITAKKELDSSDILFNCSGIRILDSIALAQLATFYVCHHGTIQHKIGWFTETPGYVHSNSDILKLLPGEYIAGQGENLKTPHYENFEEVNQKNYKQDDTQKLDNYYFNNDKSIIKNIINIARNCM